MYQEGTNQMGMVTEKRRYNLIDAYRGFTILVMIGYHFSYDVFILYGKYPQWLSNPFGYVWQQFICISFILISGFSASFSRSHLKRGILLNICGLIVTVVTMIASPQAVIYFGVLNLLGCSLLLLIPAKKFVNDKNWGYVAVISLFLFFLTRHIQSGYLGFGDFELIQMPMELYTAKALTPLGFPYPGFFSSDYFPVIPWFFLFFTGYSCHYVLQMESMGKLRDVLSVRVPFLSWLGQKSLIIYLLHQPVLMGICVILF